MALHAEPARPHDLPGALDLLRRSDLAQHDVAERWGHYFVVREDDGRVVAVAGLEVHGADGLLRGLSLHVGPELTAGAFVRLPPPDVTDASGAVYSGSASAHFTGAVALDLVVAVTPALRFEGGLPQLRWVPTGDGSILVLGATLGAGYRF